MLTSSDTALHNVSSVGHRIQACLQLVDELGRRDYPSPSPRGLAEVLRRILVRLFSRLDEASSDTVVSNYQDVLMQVHTINYATIALAKLLESVKNAQISPPLAAIVEAYEDIGDRIVHGTQTIIYPQWAYNASYIDAMRFLREWADVISPEVGQGIFQGAPQHFVVISFPAIEERNILRQAVLAHEMGHFVDETKGVSAKILKGKVFGSDDFSSFLSSDSPAAKRTVLQLATRMVDNWIRELTADAIGVCLLGPAHAFSFEEVVRLPVRPGPPRATLTHPPYSLRIKHMVKLTQEIHLKPLQSMRLKRGERHILNNVSDMLSSLATGTQGQLRISDLPGSEEDARAIYAIGERVVERSAQVLRTEMEKQKGESYFCRPLDILHAIQLQPLLENGLPPSELESDSGGVPSFAAIMNSSWFFFLQHELDYSYFESSQGESPEEPSSVFKRYQRLQALISKAIEISRFKAEFSRRKGT
jgi:hypothetical protein